MRKIIKLRMGFCPCCKKRTIFIAFDYLLREYYKCTHCWSITRQRAFMTVLESRCKEWKNLMIHESSPCGPTFVRMKKLCPNYSYSFFYPDKALGQVIDESGKVTNQDLQQLTFPDNTFDLFVTQDVFEHIPEPEKALKEIYRCLKPGGRHIFTVPTYPFLKSRPRIRMEGGKIVPIMEVQYHGNPISEDGSLVTYDWGGDIGYVIDSLTGFKTEVIEFYRSRENNRNGLEADGLQVFISTKPEK